MSSVKGVVGSDNLRRSCFCSLGGRRGSSFAVVSLFQPVKADHLSRMVFVRGLLADTFDERNGSSFASGIVDTNLGVCGTLFDPSSGDSVTGVFGWVFALTLGMVGSSLDGVDDGARIYPGRDGDSVLPVV